MKALNRVLEYAKGIEGDVTQSDAKELTRLHSCLISEIRNTNKVDFPLSHDSVDIGSMTTIIYELLLRIAYDTGMKNFNKKYINEILNRI